MRLQNWPAAAAYVRLLTGWVGWLVGWSGLLGGFLYGMGGKRMRFTTKRGTSRFSKTERPRDGQSVLFLKGSRMLANLTTYTFPPSFG
jgi:hypothetical protein